MSKISAAQQADAVEAARQDGEIREAELAAATKSLRLIASNPEYFRAVYQLAKDHPVLAEIFTAFPGSEIVSVRRTDLDEGADEKT